MQKYIYFTVLEIINALWCLVEITQRVDITEDSSRVSTAINNPIFQGNLHLNAIIDEYNILRGCPNIFFNKHHLTKSIMNYKHKRIVSSPSFVFGWEKILAIENAEAKSFITFALIPNKTQLTGSNLSSQPLPKSCILT